MLRLTPFWYLHSRLLGRPALITVPLALAGLLIFGMLLTRVWLFRDETRGFILIWTTLLFMSQGAIALIFAPAQVRKAVLRDFSSGMMESHRLSPLSSASLIASYMTAPLMQAALLYLVLALCNFVLLAFMGEHLALGGIGSALGLWGATAMATFSGALLIASFVLVTALTTAGKGNAQAWLAGLGFFGGWVLLSLIPGVGLLIGVPVLTNLFGPTAAPTGQRILLGTLAIIFQTLLSLVLLFAAARVVRSPERKAFSVDLAFALLLLSGVILAFGLRLNQRSADDGPSYMVETISSLLAFWVIGLIGVLAVARARVERAWTIVLGGRVTQWEGLRLRLMPIHYGILSAALLLAAAIIFPYVPSWSPSQLGTRMDLLLEPRRFALLVVSFIASTWALTEIATALVAMGRVRFVMFAAVAVLQAFPLLLDLGSSLFLEPATPFDEPAAPLPVPRLATVTAAGAVLAAAHPEGFFNAVVGVAIQCVIAVVVTFLCGQIVRARIQSPRDMDQLASLQTPPTSAIAEHQVPA